MEPRFWVIVLGSLAAVIALFISGFFVASPWGGLMIAAGTLAGVAWFLAAIYITNALNSDI